MLQSKILRRLAAAAGLWLAASSVAAAQHAPASVPIGQVALPPEAFVAFCQRRPGDCGPDVSEVLEGARLALAERRSLLAPVAASAATAAVDASGPRLTRAVWTPDALLPAPEPVEARIEAAAAPKPVVFVRPGDPPAEAAAGPPALTPGLWAELNRVNARVNRAIRQRTDNEVYLRDDFWTTPLQDGLGVGDCEDFVLEKRRALLAAGLPREALNIAVVITREGDTHAVLLVNTRKGEFVLDNLSPWILPWAQAPYRWRQRQVNGEAFNWAMAAPEVAPAFRRGGVRLAAR